MKPKIKIDIVSDVVCPWCYIGKRRLEKAVSQLSGEYEFDIEYSPFELNPNMPKEGRNQKDYLAAKFGGDEQYHKLTGRVAQVAAEEGLAFNFEDQKVSPNTHDAHRLIWLAARTGKQKEVNEAFMSAYFQEGIDLSKRDNLKAAAIGAGLNPLQVETLLTSDEGSAEISYAQQLNHQRGITGVPFYIINDKYGISGAQPVEVLLETLRKVGEN